MTAPFADGGIGSRFISAADRYIDDYVFSPEEFVMDHEPSEFEREMIRDCFMGLTGDSEFCGVLKTAQDAANSLAGLIAALKEAREYFAERADADQPAGCDHPIGNAEMTLLVEIDAALAKAGAA